MDPVRAYSQLVNGLTEVTRQRARDAGVTQAAEGAAATARVVRQVLGELVRAEVAQSVTSLGLASSGEVDRLRRRVEALERRVDRIQQPNGAEDVPTPSDMPPVAHPPAAATPAGKRAGASKRTAKSTTRKSTTAKSTTARTAKRAPTRKASG